MTYSLTTSLTLILLIVFSDFISAVSKGLCKVIKTSKKVILIRQARATDRAVYMLFSMTLQALLGFRRSCLVKATLLVTQG